MIPTPESMEELLDSAKDVLRTRLEGQWPETSTDHWIPWLDHSENFGHVDLCRGCAEAIVQWCLPVLKEAGDEEADNMFVDGGWASEHDSCAFCEFCGLILLTSHTDHFVEAELEHFAENGVDDHFWVLEALDEVSPYHSTRVITDQAIKVAHLVLAGVQP